MKSIHCRLNFLSMRTLWRQIIMIALFVVSAVVSADPLQVVIPRWGNNDQHDSYFYKLLALALEKTNATDGLAEIQVYPEELSGTRLMSDLKKNITIDVVWNGTTPQREQDFIPIYISLLKELNENRILLIRSEDQEKFSAVQTLDDLRKFKAGSGADWPSRAVLQNSDIPVVVVNNGGLLFPMLKVKRFDFISRNLFEVWDEEIKYAKAGLAVEKTLLLHGGVPFYFFVNKNNTKLANRIDRGLKIAIADGSFDKLFFSYSEFKQGYDEIKAGHRKVLHLNKE